jgi:hypothetical protein
MHKGLFNLLILLTGAVIGSGLAAPAHATVSKALPKVTLVDSRKCENPNSPYDPFNPTVLKPCAWWVVYEQIEMSPGVNTVVMNRLPGGLNTRGKSAERATSTIQNFQIADEIDRIQKRVAINRVKDLMGDFRQSREQTQDLVTSIQQLRDRMDMTSVRDEFLDFAGQSVLARAVELLVAARDGKDKLGFTMDDQLKNRIDFAVSQIRPARESGAALADASMAKSLTAAIAQKGKALDAPHYAPEHFVQVGGAVGQAHSAERAPAGRPAKLSGSAF